MALIHVTNMPDTREQWIVTGVATQGVRRIGGKRNEAATTHDFRGLLDEARLGLFGMKREELGHDEPEVSDKPRPHRSEIGRQR